MRWAGGKIWKGLINCLVLLFTLLKTVEYDVEVCGISIVPERLKESNEDAYMPRVVSIGPRYRGTREDLLLMEKIKLGCMLSLIHRAGGPGDAVEYLKKCTEAIQRLDHKVRQRLNDELPSRLQPPGPAPVALKEEELFSDLILLENQIPFLVLHVLSHGGKVHETRPRNMLLTTKQQQIPLPADQKINEGFGTFTFTSATGKLEISAEDKKVEKIKKYVVKGFKKKQKIQKMHN
ncbi:hypothetical protein SESBI_50560 [Sesbania bispinosa]|nr:hypothetical protein SESBI_50560 [Sesbania bispinosa]